ncbi:MAG: hypothetical protein MHM6MM_005359 [Cercozoa sp. M6MM]
MRSTRRTLLACRRHTASGPPDALGTSVFERRLMLGRDFVHESLYDEKHGYFNRQQVIFAPDLFDPVLQSETQSLGKVTGSELVSTAHRELPWKRMRTRMDYYNAVDALYDASETAWLTPSELFAPYYGHSIARWLLRQYDAEVASGARDPSAPVVILEVGGGNGTLCGSVLSLLRSERPDVFKHCEYHVCELSARLASVQKERLQRHYDAGGTELSSKVRTHAQSITNWKRTMPEGVFVVAIEVLDNMPHDKCVGPLLNAHEYETEDEFVDACRMALVEPVGEKLDYVSASKDGSVDPVCQEHLTQVTDPLTREALAIFQETWTEQYNTRTNRQLRQILRSEVMGRKDAGVGQSFLKRMFTHGLKSVWQATINTRPKHQNDDVERSTNAFFAPTTALEFLHVLRDHFPRHHLFCADFAWFGAHSLGGFGAPICAGKDVGTGGSTKDYETYLLPLGTADIMYQVQFRWLWHAYRRVMNRDAFVRTHRQFIDDYAREEDIYTTSLPAVQWCPFRDDWQNFATLLTESAGDSRLVVDGLDEPVFFPYPSLSPFTPKHRCRSGRM